MINIQEIEFSQHREYLHFPQTDHDKDYLFSLDIIGGVELHKGSITIVKLLDRKGELIRGFSEHQATALWNYFFNTPSIKIFTFSDEPPAWYYDLERLDRNNLYDAVMVIGAIGAAPDDADYQIEDLCEDYMYKDLPIDLLQHISKIGREGREKLLVAIAEALANPFIKETRHQPKEPTPSQLIEADQ